MPERKQWTLPRGLIALLGAGLAVRLGIALIHYQFIVRTGLFGDDAFYFLNIARHLAQGHGVTHDGINPTNGIQPLYTFMLVPLFWICGDNEILPIHLAGVMLAVFSAGSGGLLFLLVRHLAGQTAGLVALALWMFSPYVLRQTLNGMETGVSAFFLIASMWWYVTRIRPQPDRPNPSARTLVAGGCFLGLAILSRMDNVLLAAVMAGDYLLASRRNGSAGLRRATVFVSPAALALAGWLTVNLVTSGSLLPVSGRAVRLLSRLYVGAGDEETLAEIPVRPASMAETWRETVPSALDSFTNARQWRFLFAKLAGKPPALVASCALLLTLLAVAAHWSRGVDLLGKLRRAWKRCAPIHWMLVHALLLLAAYSLYVFGTWFFPRYLFPKAILGTIFFAVVYDALVVRTWSRARPWLPPAMGWLLGAILAAQFVLGAAYYLKSRQGFEDYYEAVVWLNWSDLDPEIKVGAFQSGLIGYFARHTVIGLDGVVNEDAYEALRDGTLFEYLERADIRVLIDEPRVLEALCATDPNYADLRPRMKPLKLDGFEAYELPDPGG